MDLTLGAAPLGASRPRARRVAASTAALLAGAMIAAGATPASATLTGPEVDAGENITVFANIDMVAVFGIGAVGDVLTVQVIRNGAVIGTATGPTVSSDEGPALEVNHGPEGTPRPGDCWEGNAPNISAKDRIVVRHHKTGELDEVTVDDIHFTDPPESRANGDVVVRGVAFRANGDPIAASFLDSAEFRDDSGKYRTAPTVEATPNVPGGFTLRYSPDYTDPEGRNRDNLTEAQRKAALLREDGHSIGFGHTDPLPKEAMLVDGLTDDPGHAPGCGGTPAEPADPDPFEPGPDPGPGPAPAPTTRTVTVYPSADTMVRQHSQRSSFGRSSTLHADSKATNSDRSRETAYLKFAIPGLRAGETITGAKLHLNVTNGTGNGPSVRHTATGWSESMTWSSQPGVLGPSANFGNLPSGKRSIALDHTKIAASQTVSYQLWAESRDGLAFSSKESGTTGNRPYVLLTITKG